MPERRRSAGRSPRHSRGRFTTGTTTIQRPTARRWRPASPLTDADRRPWLDALRDVIAATRGAGSDAIVACSGLSRAHRDHLRHAGVTFVFLRSSPGILRERLQAREGHFFPADLLESQLAALEEPREGLIVDATRSPAAVVQEIRERLGLGDDPDGSPGLPRPAVS